jgi:hypothetical protein
MSFSAASLAILAIAVSLPSCFAPRTSGGDAAVVPAADYFPLRAGAAWRFEKTGGHSRRLEIGVPNDDGQFPLFAVTDADQRLPMARLSVEGDGALVLRAPQGVQVLLREPVKSGATWEWEVSPESRARQRAWIESVEEREVGGEVRSCVRVAFGPSRARVQERYVFARGVGWIAIERQLPDGTSESLTLRSYSPGGVLAPAAETPAAADPAATGG